MPFQYIKGTYNGLFIHKKDIGLGLKKKKLSFLPFFVLPSQVNMNQQTHNMFNEMPIELREYLTRYLDQSEIIQDLRETIKTLLNRNEVLRRNNQRLTLQVIDQLNNIRNLEFILANGLNDPEDRAVARELNFDVLSDSDYSDAETVIDVDI